MSMLIRRPGEQWREPEGHGYGAEDDLQAIIAEHPTLVPGVLGDAIACREFQSGAGAADVLVLGTDGTVTVVECKLAANPQIRREIIGQLLDYASRLWQMPIDEFETRWVARTQLSPFTALDDTEGTLRREVADALTTGRFNLVLAVDEINADLRRIVEYLNAVTSPQTGVIAVEYVRFADGETELLMPQAYGAELQEAKAGTSSTLRPQWTVDQYLNWCSEHDPQGLNVISALFAALKDNGFWLSGGRAATPSISAGIDVPGVGAKFPVIVYTDPSKGALIEVRLTDFEHQPRIAKNLDAALSQIPDLPLPLDIIRESRYRKRPNIQATSYQNGQVEALARAMAAVLRRR